ncbi:hypothetical protein GCK72_014693 [Caenorhabditis remanei]|uniref:Ephrin-4 n=1 Tax=Caenorhabditis remanei TaxID=31234 RepID=A0A6A5GUS6_CAERE|nr:hypothetical protein GCK72_014693 [Caenorhabditis remanei]KAF1758235.1 hypothetical protein GCK72_014693 [Caenorhabditis remanei]
MAVNLFVFWQTVAGGISTIGMVLVNADAHVPDYRIEKGFRNRLPFIEVRLGDVVRFVCPDNEGRSNGEYLTIYEVTEFARDECALESNKREVVRCGVETNAEKLIRSHQLPVLNPKQPIPPKNVAQFIRPVNPIPNGKEYQPGLTYYFITTSNGKASGIDQKMYGLCESHNMRLSMKVSPSQPSASTIKPKAPTRRQEDSVTKSSAEMMGGQEDEDSENDNAHLLPRDLEIATNPKFRRPSQFEQAAVSAGVQDQQLLKVIQMAKEGKTGTFENDRQAEAHKNAEKEAWHPVSVQYVADLMNTAYKNADERVTYQRDPDFLIHEEDFSANSLEYSSSSRSLQSFIAIFVAVVFLF